MRRLLLVLLAVLSAAAAVAVPIVSADAAVTVTSGLQAENMHVPPRVGHRVDVRGASGGAVLAMLGSGTAEAWLISVHSFNGVDIRARATTCLGAPAMRLTIDGRPAKTWSVSSSAWRDYVVGGTWRQGRHLLAVTFPNDLYRGRRCDRNLYVDRITTTMTVHPPAPVAPPAPAPTPTPAPTPAPTVASGNPFAGAVGYVDPDSAAKQAADALRSTDPTGAAALDKVAAHPQADWIGDWDPTSTVAQTVRGRVATESATGALPVLVLYAIPDRDCGSYSAGGVGDPAAYAAWIDQVAVGLAGSKAAIVLEPDALAGLDCLSAADQATREQMLADAVTRLGADPNAAVYLDAGNPGWQPVATMAARLRAANVAHARGFALNVSNFVDTAANLAYGDQLVAALRGGHFIVDTSRNGLGSDGQWCNPDGRALGTPFTAATGDPHADALTWIKRPGESDGTCNGGPAAGTFWPAYAIGLAERAAF